MKGRKVGSANSKRAVFVLLGMMLLLAPNSSAQQVKTDHDRSANFTQYKTYSWEQVKTRDALDVDRIKAAVNATAAAAVFCLLEPAGKEDKAGIFFP